jgi:hypothetical protein
MTIGVRNIINRTRQAEIAVLKNRYRCSILSMAHPGAVESRLTTGPDDGIAQGAGSMDLSDGHRAREYGIRACESCIHKAEIT